MTDDSADPSDSTDPADSADSNDPTDSSEKPASRSPAGRSHDSRPLDDSAGPLDVPTLEVLGRRASSHGLVEGWAFRPDSLSPRRLEIRLDPRQYPASVVAARLDVRWFEGGEYAVHYIESRETEDGEDEGTWQCRWDRHPKPDGPRVHFHPPPDASEDVEESTLTSPHHLGVLFSVLDRVGDRIGTLHGE